MQKQKLSRRDFLRGAGLAGVGVALAGCGAATPETIIQTVEVEKEVQVEVEKEVVVTATPPPAEAASLLMWFQAENHKPEYDRRKAELEDTFGITLTYELLARETMTKKFPTTLMAGSGYPDIIEQNAEDIVKFMKGSDADIPMVALNEVLDSGPYAGKVLQSRFDRYTKDGKIYGAPHDVHPVLLLYHDAGWKEYGVDLETVKTWDDYVAALEAVGAEATMSDGRPRYGVMEATYSAGVATLMLQNGVWWTDENEEPMITAPGWKTAFETWFRMNPYRVDIDWGNQVAMFKEGQFLSEFVPDWLYGIHKQGTAEDADFVANSPMRLKFVPDGPAAGSWGGTSGSVVKQSANIEKAVEVLLYLYFEDGEGQLAQRFVDTGILPPVPSNWDNEVYQEAIPYLGGQVGGELFKEAANALPSYHENWKTPIVSNAWSEQLTLVVGGELTLDEAITIADENARAEIEKNI
ncbi:MAG: extracellular solute-binding protein [Anaerolineae bacterium]|nr:extracellular solute-binding protein [Anaerolineae bacterium]